MEGGHFLSNQGTATNRCEEEHNHGRDLTKGELSVDIQYCISGRLLYWSGNNRKGITAFLTGMESRLSTGAAGKPGDVR